MTTTLAIYVICPACGGSGAAPCPDDCPPGPCDHGPCPRKCAAGEVEREVEVEGDVDHDPGYWRNKNGDGLPESWAVEVTSAVDVEIGKVVRLDAAQTASAKDALCDEYERAWRER